MNNPFHRSNQDSPEDEQQAAELFLDLADETLGDEAATSIRRSMLAALASSGRTVAARSRWAMAGTALMAPMLAIGAVSAAAGQSPVGGTISAVTSAVTTLGIGSGNDGVQQDENSDSQEPGDTPEATAQHGNSANAPGHGRGDATATPTPGGTATPTPTANDGSGSGGSGSASATPTEKPDPHANGKGCDDVLFANGEPPFASPGGPVGCDVGNSGDHRQNGAHQGGGTGGTPTATPTAGETPTPTGTAGTTDQPGNGHGNSGGSNGHGNGHNASDTPAPETTPVPTGGSTNTGSSGHGNSGSGGDHGNSGNAPGKNR
jgi:hypothetical protein